MRTAPSRTEAVSRPIVKLPIAEIQIGDRVRREYGELKVLAESIREHGLFHPIGVTPERVLIFGERRLRACRDVLGWEKIPCCVIDIAAIAFGEHDENELHKAFTASEKVALARAVHEAIGNRQGARADLDSKKGANQLQQNIAEVRRGQQTRDVAAERAGFGNRTTYEQARAVCDKGVPELVEAMDSGSLSISAASEIATLSAAQQRRALKLDSSERVEFARQVREERTARDDEPETPQRAGKGLASRAAEHMVEIPKAVGARRSRAADSAAIVHFFLEHLGVTERTSSEIPGARCSSLEISCVLPIVDAARLLRMDPGLYNPVGNRRHYSPEQLDYVEAIIRDIPKTLRMAVLSVARPPA